MTQHMTAMPTRAEQVSAAWLEEALQDRMPGARIHALTLDETWPGTATKLRCAVEANDVARMAGLPASIVIKGRFMPELQIVEKVYAAEVLFYRDIAPELGIRVPRCFFAGSDHKAGQHIVVLEDLNCRDARFQRIVRPIDEGPVRRFIDNMARWHARYWNSPELNAGGRLAHLFQFEAIASGAEGEHGRRQLLPDVWDHHINLPRGIGLPNRFRDRNWMEAAMHRLNEIGAEGDRTLLHGDHHLGNLYIEADGEVGVFDWQTISCGSWAHDLTYFLVSALDIEDRRRWDRALISYYLARLEAFGVTHPPSFDAAMYAYRAQILYGLFYWTMNPVEWQVELNNCAAAPRYAIAALDHDTAGLLERGR